MSSSPKIERLTIPTPFRVGAVNCYLIEDDPLTLVDTGPNSGTALTALERGLAEHGRRIEDLERIVLTHQHMDHIGLAGILAERSGATVATIDLLAPWLTNYERSIDRDDAFAEEIMRRHGVPDDMRVALRAASSGFWAWGGACTVTEPLTDGGLLDFASGGWRVHHRPGHSPSDTIFVREQTGLMLSGDHLLKHGATAPLVARPLELPADADLTTVPRPRALRTFLDSLAATAALPSLGLTLGGHGDEIDNPRELIAQRIRGPFRRGEKILRFLRENGPHTAFEIALGLWGNVAVMQIFMTVSETLGHLDLLEEQGQVTQLRDGLTRFAAT